MKTKPEKRSGTEKPVCKRTPLRRCVVCRSQGPKEGFLRAVLTKDGKVSLDESGKAGGRGAYVCKTAACLNKLIKQRGFNRSFKRDAGTEVYEKAAELLASGKWETANKDEN